MFSALRQGSPLYVLDRQNAVLQIGTVVSVSQPTGFSQYIPNLPGQTMDVTVKYEDGTQNEFKQLQSGMSLAAYGNVVITETREQMIQEVENMARNSKSVLDSVEFHKKVLGECDGMMRRLSPSFAKEVETDKRLNVLEQSQRTIEEGQKEILALLAKMSSGKPKTT